MKCDMETPDSRKQIYEFELFTVFIGHSCNYLCFWIIVALFANKITEGKKEVIADPRIHIIEIRYSINEFTRSEIHILATMIAGLVH